MTIGARSLLAPLLMLGACAPRQLDSNWAIDQQAVYCANTRAGGLIIGNPQAFSGVPLIGRAASATAGLLHEEEACKVVRGLRPDDITQLKTAQVAAARENRALTSGPFTITPRPVGAECLPVVTLHRPSGQTLRPETLCRDKQGSYAPFGQR